MSPVLVYAALFKLKRVTLLVALLFQHGVGYAAEKSIPSHQLRLYFSGRLEGHPCSNHGQWAMRSERLICLPRALPKRGITSSLMVEVAALGVVPPPELPFVAANCDPWARESRALLDPLRARREHCLPVIPSYQTARRR